jgi:hypothetical protein
MWQQQSQPMELALPGTMFQPSDLGQKGQKEVGEGKGVQEGEGKEDILKNWTSLDYIEKPYLQINK